MSVKATAQFSACATNCCSAPAVRPLTFGSRLCLLRRASLAGGVLVADDTTVDLSGSTFTGNYAGQNGGVAYFRQNSPLPSASVQTLILTCTASNGTCAMTGNNATRWGAVVSLDITSLRVVAPTVTRPGIGFTSSVTLYDGVQRQPFRRSPWLSE